jgi:signal transduction histidine kinase/CheY-like chemotaxis protein
MLSKLENVLIHHLKAGIVVLDSQQKIVIVNQSFCNMVGIHDVPSSLIGKDVKALPIPSYVPLHECETFKDEIILSNGKVLERSCIPFCIDGTDKGSVWIFDDVTEQRHMERFIKCVKEQIKKANEAKAEMISKMGHELRTPLNCILGFAQLLEMDSSLSIQQQEFVKEVLNGARHLLNLVNEMLDLSRVESGKIKITYDWIKIESVIEESIKLIQPLANEKKIKVINGVNMDDEHYVYIDPMRLRQILLNLLENAVKYNNENGIVKITSKYKEGSVYIHIKDSGMGIPQNELDKIFEPFYRIKGTKIDGTGIGLSLVKQLVELMGGELGVESEVGKGSDFWFSLPVVNHSHDLGDKMNHSSFQEKPQQMEQKKILYIEDHLSNLNLLKKVMSSMSYLSLFAATCGKEGLDIIFNEHIDLILLDMNLPDMTGYEVIEILQKNERTNHIPVIALSANAMPEEIQKALEKGVKYFISKPIDIQQFLQKIEKFL